MINLIEQDKYVLKLQNFEGPLELLCHLIDKNKMDICDVNINEITGQYILYLEQMEELNLEIASEFLTLASTLIYIKSKNLLPTLEESEEELTEEELLRKIIEYKRYKEITKIMLKDKENADLLVYKTPDSIELPKQKLEENYSPEELIRVYKQLLNKNKNKVNKDAINIEKIAVRETVSVSSKVKQIFKLLIKKSRFVFNKVFSTEKNSKQEVVAAFLGALEMSNRNKIILSQNRLFGDITVERKKRKAS